MRSGVFAIGTVLLIIGALIVANDQPKVNAVESMFGGWAMLSPEYQNIVQELMMAYVLMLIGIIVLIVGVVTPSKSKLESLTCSYCNYASLSDEDLNIHLCQNHLDKSPFKCEHCDFIGFTEVVLQTHYKDDHPDKKKWKWN